MPPGYALRHHDPDHARIQRDITWSDAIERAPVEELQRRWAAIGKKMPLWKILALAIRLRDQGVAVTLAPAMSAALVRVYHPARAPHDWPMLSALRRIVGLPPTLEPHERLGAPPPPRQEQGQEQGKE